MDNKLYFSPIFEEKLRRFIKKFPTLLAEIEDFKEEILTEPTLGISLGAGLYKIRLKSKSKGRGKSGGFRIISYLLNQTKDGTEIHLITIYDKSEDSTIKKQDLLKIIKQLFY